MAAKKPKAEPIDSVEGAVKEWATVTITQAKDYMKSVGNPAKVRLDGIVVQLRVLLSELEK